MSILEVLWGPVLLRFLSPPVTIILLLLFSLIFVQPVPRVIAANSAIVLSVVSEDSSTPNLVDPTFTVGSSFNMTVVASNSTGIAGFDITLSYNASILKVHNARFDSPFCPSTDGCVFDLPSNDTLTVARSFDSPPGTTRLAMIGLGPSHTATPPILLGQPSILFRIEFDVVGKGITSLSIQQSASQLLGFTKGCGAILPYTIQNGSFDNRAPFTVRATPSSGAVSPGQSLSVLVNVSQVNSAGSGNVSLVLSGIVPVNGNVPLRYAFKPQWGILDVSIGLYDFTSTLTMTTTVNTPPGNYNLTIIGVIPRPAPNSFQYNLNFTLSVSITPSISSPNITPAARSNQTPAANSIAADPPTLISTFTTSSSPTEGHPVTFTAVAIWCGTPDYTIRWSFGDGSFGSANPATHTYNGTGPYSVTLTVTDTNGNVFSSTQTLNVGNVPPPSPPPQSPSFDTSILAEVIILFLVVLAGLFYFRRRRSRL